MNQNKINIIENDKDQKTINQKRRYQYQNTPDRKLQEITSKYQDKTN